MCSSVPETCWHRSPRLCTWEVAYEESSQGWCLVKYSQHRAAEDTTLSPVDRLTANHHSHNLLQSRAEVLAKKQGRAIEPAVAEFGRITAAAWFSVAEVSRAMRAKAEAEGFQTDWSYDDVYSLIKDVRAMPSSKDLDATNLLEYLTEREKTFGLRYFARTDGDRLNMLFFELEGGFDDLAWMRRHGECPTVRPDLGHQQVRAEARVLYHSGANREDCCELLRTHTQRGHSDVRVVLPLLCGGIPHSSGRFLHRWRYGDGMCASPGHTSSLLPMDIHVLLAPSNQC